MATIVKVTHTESPELPNATIQIRTQGGGKPEGYTLAVGEKVQVSLNGSNTVTVTGGGGGGGKTSTAQVINVEGDPVQVRVQGGGQSQEQSLDESEVFEAPLDGTNTLTITGQ